MVDFDDDAAPDDGGGDDEQPDPILDNAKKLRAAGASIDQIKQYLTSKGYSFNGPQATPPQQNVSAFSQRHPNYAQQAATENAADLANSGPGVASNVLGTLASLTRDIPGVPIAQAGASALVNQIPYRQAYNQITETENATPKALAIPARVLGGGVAAMAMPGLRSLSPALQGAAYGGASGLLSANPDETLGQRALGTAIGAGTGAIAGKVADQALNAGRALFTPSLGKQAVDLAAETKDLTTKAYALARAQADANGGTSPVLQQIMQDSDIAPYVAKVRASRQYGNASDSEVAMQAYKLMARTQANLTKGMRLDPSTYDAAKDLAAGDLRLAKQDLRGAFAEPSEVTIGGSTNQVFPEHETFAGPTTPLGQMVEPAQSTPLGQALRDFPNPSNPNPQGPAGPGFMLRGDAGGPIPGANPGVAKTIPPVSPGFPAAVDTRALQGRITEANQLGQDAAARLINGTQLAGKNQASKSLEATLGQFKDMSQAEKDAALQGVLGRVKGNAGFSPNPLRGFGLPATLGVAGKVTPLVQALEGQGVTWPDIVRAIAASQGHPSP